VITLRNENNVLAVYKLLHLHQWIHGVYSVGIALSYMCLCLYCVIPTLFPGHLINLYEPLKDPAAGGADLCY